jgi:E3 ubiquitin-protein ligase NRDP1
MLSQVDEVRREMESRLDSQRRHMVQKESQLKNDVEELKVTAWSLMKVYLVSSNR